MNKPKPIIILLLSSLILFILLSSISFFIIYYNVKSVSIKARNEYNKNCTESLIELIKSENHSFKEMNDAVWALGQIADKGSLSFLNELLKDSKEFKPCDRNKYLCKYEVEKAIKWCTKGNITGWMYKNRDNWK